MPIRSRKIDSHIERLIVTGMIVSDQFLQEVQPIFDKDLLETPLARTVSAWCLDYWGRYKKSPGLHVQHIYNSQTRSKDIPDEQVELIGDFLASISGEHERAEQFNVGYMLSQAEERFKERSLHHVAEDIQTLLMQGETAKAEVLLAGYKRVARPQSSGISPLDDQRAIYEALAKRERDVLFSFPGALGKFVGPVERSTLTALMGPEKRGKSWWLMEIALRAIKASCNVVHFVIGDMNQADMVRRIHKYNTISSDRFAGEVRMPVLDCRLNQENRCDQPERTSRFGVMRRRQGGDGWEPIDPRDVPDYKPCTACVDKHCMSFEGAVWYEHIRVDRLDWRRAYEAGQKTMQRARGKRLKLSTHSSDVMSVSGLCVLLDLWERAESFVPDVIVIDYADNLAPEDRRTDFRHQQNQTWQALRRLSQERNCAVFTATQADADSYDRISLGARNFSEDKRKYGHATAFWTLNQTAKEKRAGLLRIGRMFVREDDFDIGKHCMILQCPKLGRPYLDSYLVNKGGDQ